MNLSTSEYNITYLFGAGASANALPTVKSTQTTKGIPDALRDCANLLKEDKSINSSFTNLINKLVQDLNWLAEHSEKFGTPDTFAKFLYLQDRSSLPRLKNTLSLYFTIEQFINKKIDSRVLIFLTTVMEIGNMFPTNIKILTWNYDFQLQLAAETFRKEEFSLGSVSVHKPPLINYYPTLGWEFNMNHKNSEMEFSLIHLNGLAGFYFDKSQQANLNYFYNSPLNNLNELFEKLNKNPEIGSLITFAWERDTESSRLLHQRINFSKKTIEETDILVIIGYSFPFFNRQVDKRIFDTLTSNGKLKKIIFQDPYKSGEFLKKQFNLSDEIEIIDINYVDNYFVPNEL